MVTEINFNAPCNVLGYGIAASNLLQALSENAKVNLWPIGPIGAASEKLQKSAQKSLDNSLTADFSQPTIKVWHQNQLIDRPGRGKYYGFPIFELDNFTPAELLSLSCPHELIVCSKWAKTVLSNFISQPIHVVPLGIDTELFYPSQNENTGPYKFFNVGKWELRKGHDVLVECFNRAFDLNDDVELHMMCENPFLQPEQIANWHALYKNSDLGDKIYIHNRVNTHIEVADFMRSMDCGVFISRAEGFNLDLLEAMSVGAQVIATNYSAHTEFCTPDNTNLVDVQDLEPANDGIWFHGQGNWAYIGEAQKEQTIEHMRYCYKNRICNKAGVLSGRQYTWTNSADGILNVISN